MLEVIVLSSHLEEVENVNLYSLSKRLFMREIMLPNYKAKPEPETIKKIIESFILLIN